MQKMEPEPPGRIWRCATNDPRIGPAGEIELVGDAISPSRLKALRQLDRRLRRKQTWMERLKLYAEIVRRGDLFTDYGIIFNDELQSADFANAMLDYEKEKSRPHEAGRRKGTEMGKAKAAEKKEKILATFVSLRKEFPLPILKRVIMNKLGEIFSRQMKPKKITKGAETAIKFIRKAGFSDSTLDKACRGWK